MVFGFMKMKKALINSHLKSACKTVVINISSANVDLLFIKFGPVSLSAGQIPTAIDHNRTMQKASLLF